MNNEFPQPAEEVKRLASEIEALRGDMQVSFRKLAQMEKRLRAVFPNLPKKPKALPEQARQPTSKSEEQLKPLLREGPDGRLRWHWDPALLDGVVSESERYQPRLFSAAAKLHIPLLLLSGGRSDVVSHATVNEFLQLVPHARHVELPQATHMLAGDANDAFTREIARFVRDLESMGVRHNAGAV